MKELTMAKHDTDPVLRELVHAVNESGQARVPVVVSTHGTVLTGLLIAQDAYFAEVAESNPLMSALQPGTGMLGKDYARDVTAEEAHHLHIRSVASDGDRFWRVSLEAVDGWTLDAGDDENGAQDRGPFAWLLN
jgi:hypothetical protein